MRCSCFYGHGTPPKLIETFRRKEFDSFLLHFDLRCDTVNIEKGKLKHSPR